MPPKKKLKGEDGEAVVLTSGYRLVRGTIGEWNMS